MQHATIHYGMKSKNPLEKMYYYEKKDPDEAIPLKEEQVNYMYNACGDTLFTLYTCSYLRCYPRDLGKTRSEFFVRERNT